MITKINSWALKNLDAEYELKEKSFFMTLKISATIVANVKEANNATKSFFTK